MAETAMERLINAGHTDIGVVWPHGDQSGLHFSSNDAGKFWRHNLTLRDEYIFRARPNEAGGYAMAQEDSCQPTTKPTAITLINETLVTGLYKGLEEAGIKPGKDIAIIGTTVRTPGFCLRH